MGKEIVLVFFILIALVWIITQSVQYQNVSYFTTSPYPPAIAKTHRDRQKGKIMFNDDVKQRVYDKKTGNVGPEMIIPINDLSND